MHLNCHSLKKEIAEPNNDARKKIVKKTIEFTDDRNGECVLSPYVTCKLCDFVI